MCKMCFCENEMQCSVKGYQPEGWCCDHCEYLTSTKTCKLRSQQIQIDSFVTGFCLACRRKGVQLDWIQSKTQKGFCHACSQKLNKKELLDILLDSCELV